MKAFCRPVIEIFNTSTAEAAVPMPAAAAAPDDPADFKAAPTSPTAEAACGAPSALIYMDRSSVPFIA